jgi:hypothetical protein
VRARYRGGGTSDPVSQECEKDVTRVLQGCCNKCVGASWLGIVRARYHGGGAQDPVREESFKSATRVLREVCRG